MLASALIHWHMVLKLTRTSLALVTLQNGASHVRTGDLNRWQYIHHIGESRRVDAVCGGDTVVCSTEYIIPSETRDTRESSAMRTNIFSTPCQKDAYVTVASPSLPSSATTKPPCTSKRLIVRTVGGSVSRHRHRNKSKQPCEDEGFCCRGATLAAADTAQAAKTQTNTVPTRNETRAIDHRRTIPWYNSLV